MRDFKSFLYRCLYAVIILCIRKILPIIFYCPFAFGNRLFLNMHLVGKQHSDLFLLVFHWLFLEKVRDYVRTVRTQNQENMLHFLLNIYLHNFFEEKYKFILKFQAIGLKCSYYSCPVEIQTYP